jgi:hypothetical protein
VDVKYDIRDLRKFYPKKKNFFGRFTRKKPLIIGLGFSCQIKAFTQQMPGSK